KDLLDPGSLLPDRGDRLRVRHPPLRAARHRDGRLPGGPGPVGPGLHDRDGADHQRAAPRAGCLRRPGRRGLRVRRRPGEFSPYSWAPLWASLGAALVFLGVAAGWWIFAFGVIFAIYGVLLWVLEFSSGQHAH